VCRRCRLRARPAGLGEPAGPVSKTYLQGDQGHDLGSARAVRPLALLLLFSIWFPNSRGLGGVLAGREAHGAKGYRLITLLTFLIRLRQIRPEDLSPAHDPRMSVLFQRPTGLAVGLGLKETAPLA